MAHPNPRDVAERLLILKYYIVYSFTAPPREMLAELMEKWSDEERQDFISTAEEKRDEFWFRLKDHGLWEQLSPSERAFADATIVTMTETQQINASWRVEAAAVLMWAVQLIDSLPPFDCQASNELLKEIPSKSPPEFFAQATLRDTEHIERLRDLAELWHWRSRTKRLEGEGRAFPIDDAAKQHGFSTFDDVIRFTAKTAHQDGMLDSILDEDFAAFGKPYRSLTPDEWQMVTSITMERHFALNWLCGYAPGNRWDETPTDT